MKTPSTKQMSKWVTAGAFAFAASLIGAFVWNSLKKRSATVANLDSKIQQGV